MNVLPEYPKLLTILCDNALPKYSTFWHVLFILSFDSNTFECNNFKRWIRTLPFTSFHDGHWYWSSIMFFSVFWQSINRYAYCWMHKASPSARWAFQAIQIAETRSRPLMALMVTLSRQITMDSSQGGRRAIRTNSKEQFMKENIFVVSAVTYVSVTMIFDHMICTVMEILY